MNASEPSDVAVHERRRLLSLAYRMTGTLADAEDIVQETYIRWYRLDDRERNAIRVPAAWLTHVASRIALDLIGSAHARREQSSGQWLPEPIPAGLFAEGTPADPLEHAVRDDEVSTALLLVLESMTPLERVAFVLHDVFAVPFAEVAEIIGRSAPAARQLATAARRRVRAGRTRVVEPGEHEDVVRAFQVAAREGDVTSLLRTLAPEVEARADGGDVVRVAPNVVRGSDRVARYLLGVLHKQPDIRFEELRTADGLAYGMLGGDTLVGITAFHVEDARITDVWIVMDPRKLTAWMPLEAD